MAQQTKAKYRCTQQELYSIGETGWNNCLANITDFKTYKAFYDAPYCTGKLAAITAAKAMPDEEARLGEHEVLRTQLEPLMLACTDNYVRLEGYIKSAYPAAEVKARSESAGKNYYQTASNKDWEDVVGLNNSMMAFIAAESATLQTGNNMPGGFEAEVIADATAFLTLYNTFKDKRQTGVATGDKIAANNALYADMMKMFEDGGVIYRNDFEKKKLFTFKSVKDIVSPPGSASLKVSVLEDGDNAPIEGATITMQEEGGLILTGITDADGVYVFSNIDPGAYTGKVNKTAYTEYVFLKDVNTGTDARLDVLLVKA